jgi:hypothetical protein
MKINLHELEAHLFPEIYPYYNQYFTEEREFIGSNGLAESYNYQNMSFRVNRVKLSLNIILCITVINRLVNNAHYI